MTGAGTVRVGNLNSFGIFNFGDRGIYEKFMQIDPCQVGGVVYHAVTVPAGEGCLWLFFLKGIERVNVGFCRCKCINCGQGWSSSYDIAQYEH